MHTTTRGKWLAATLAAFLVACGGGGGGGGGLAAGIDRLGVTTGTITGFGSIIVNGVEYETSSRTKFSIDDNPGGQDDLRVGQQVTIQWSSTDDGLTRSADDVAYDTTVEGPITAGSINLQAQSLAVLGQPVLVDATTLFDSDIVPNGLEGLTAGEIVEVSGLIDANGTIRATRIERKLAADQYEVRGVVGTATASTFTVNGLTVDYSTALLKDFDDSIINAGEFVEARGDTLDGLGQLVATEVESLSGDLPTGNSGDDAEVEGFVSDFASIASFKVAGVRVNAAGAAFEDGTAANLADNVKVEAEGSFDANGVLVADKVEFKAGSSGDAVDTRITANVDSVSVANNRLAVLGITITVDGSTRLEDKGSADDGTPFNLASLSPGDYVEVRGVAGSDGVVRALLLEREDGAAEGELRGAIGTESADALTVLGVTAQINGSTAFRDTEDQAITADAFFAAVGPGTPVKVRFNQNPPGASSTPILAREIEIESD
jgi:hypothetical protein